MRILARTFGAVILVCATVVVLGQAPRGVPVEAGNPAVTAFGPSTAIVCPAGAIPIKAGASIQAAVTAAPAGASFCLGAGVHAITASITPKTGNTFTGTFGAVLDGSGWVTTESTQAAFRAHNQDIDNVTIRNLVIRDMPVNGIHAFRDFASGWTVEYNDIFGGLNGVQVSNGATVQYNWIHHNIGDPGAANAALRGGGYGFNEGTKILVYKNEIGPGNGPEQKSIDIGVIIWRANWVHGNNWVGIWVDGDGAGSIIEDNTVEDNGGPGIMWEGSQKGIIRRNTIRRSGDQAVFVSNSKTTEIYENVLEDNFRGIIYFVDCTAVGKYAWKIDLANNLAHHNTIRVRGPGAIGNGLNWTACTRGAEVPYVSNAKRNDFDHNKYLVESMTRYGGVVLGGRKNVGAVASDARSERDPAADAVNGGRV